MSKVRLFIIRGLVGGYMYILDLRGKFKKKKKKISRICNNDD